MKRSHTPGPWKIAHSSYANAPFVIYVGEIDPKWDRRYPLNGVNWIAEVKHDESEQHNEQIANAHLLHAAPRMLNLIEHLAEILAPHPSLSNQAQIDGANAAAVAIARLRVDEFLYELEREGAVIGVLPQSDGVTGEKG